MGILASGKKIVWGTLLLTWPAIALANIGDTMDQLRDRYGSAKDMGGQMLFEVRIDKGQIIPARDSANPEDHLTVTVYFDGVHSAMEVFTRNTSNPEKAELSQSDINVIKTLAADGQEWHKIEVPTGRDTWVTTDKKLLARFSPNKSGKVEDASVLVIMVNPDK